LLIFAVGCAASIGTSIWMLTRAEAQRHSLFDREATLVVSNLRSALERPLEVLEASAALFESSEEVTRSEFARFVQPALERHPGVRALEWIPIVPRAERRRYEERARAEGLAGFEFRQRGSDGNMIGATERERYLPIYYMEPGHPLVLGFDCASEPERLVTAERARQSGDAVASERIQLLDDPASVASIVTFRPVHAAGQPRTADTVRGFTCEVFRVKAVAEHAINDSVQRGIEVALLDPSAPPGRQLLFESSEGSSSRDTTDLRFESTLKYADRHWRLLLSARRGYAGNLQNAAWFVLVCGTIASALLGLGVSAYRVLGRLRRQVQEAQKLGQYTLLEKLGEGGGGVVYRAQHALLRRPTAIKLLPDAAHDSRALARFEREAQLTSELTHANTIVIYDYGRTPQGVLYYAMEYIDGVDLQKLVELDGPLPAERAVHLLKQACGALAEAHDVGLIHRDIKPSNLMICGRAGMSDFLKVMDFGLVKSLHAAPQPLVTTESAATHLVGTPLYLAPEAISGPAVDARSDIYALGAVAYFLVVGEPVFEGQTLVDLCTQHLFAAPIPPSERLRAPVAPGLEQIILRCLAKKPEQRFANVRDLLAALSSISGLEPWSDTDAATWWKQWRGRTEPLRSSA
jgi:serine/threonine-protein kinase